MTLPYPEIDPIALQLGPLAIRWYALAYIAGIVGGWFYVSSLLKHPTLWKNNHNRVMSGQPPMSKDQLDDLIFWITLGVILGGRLGYVLFYEPKLLTEAWVSVASMMGGEGLLQTLLGWIHIPPAMMIWKGGMSFHGGLIGVSLATFYFCRKNGLGILRVGDLLACATPIGLFFGRIANFINAELYGRPTDAGIGMVFPSHFDYAADQWVYTGLEVARYPSQLFEAALEGLVLFAVLFVATRVYNFLKQPGAAIGIFLMGYGVSRIIVENFREPDAFMPDFPLGLTMGMMLSLPMVILGIYLFLLNRRSDKKSTSEAATSTMATASMKAEDSADKSKQSDIEEKAKPEGQS